MKRLVLSLVILLNISACTCHEEPVRPAGGIPGIPYKQCGVNNAICTAAAYNLSMFASNSNFVNGAQCSVGYCRALLVSQPTQRQCGVSADTVRCERSAGVAGTSTCQANGTWGPCI